MLETFERNTFAFSVILFCIVGLLVWKLEPVKGQPPNSTKSLWEIEHVIKDEFRGETGYVLRNTDKRDIVGAGGQLIVSGESATLQLLIDSL